jgi:FtsP/CotA-like multicopper oxidase with cupredoxin domain
MNEMRRSLKMKNNTHVNIRFLVLLLAVFTAASLLPSGGVVRAQVNVQCPDPLTHPNARCLSLSAGDGYVTMADGLPIYIFGFSDVTGLPNDEVMLAGMLAANFPAPTIIADEGDELYLSLTNVGMVIRPDLFDPHTVHFHGFPNASAVFDGLPDSGISVSQGATLTYYYKIMDPGTYMYHCHVEAVEHMQMGMLGSLYIRPAQNRLPDGTVLGTHVHSNPDYNADRNLDNPLVGDKYAYNDEDGTTLYDVEFAIQIGSFDPVFHAADEGVQPLPFEYMKDMYPMLNGRGYPDTVNPDPLPAPEENGGIVTQKVSSLITAEVGQKILVRLSDLNVTRIYSLGTTGIPMRLVGHDARMLRGYTGLNLDYKVYSVTLGGGQSTDIILDTDGLAPGTYFLYTNNLNYLNNFQDDFGGMMTEIRLTAN